MLTEAQRNNVRSNLARVEAIGRKVGDVELGAVQCYRRSVTVTFKFDNEVNPIDDAMEFVNVIMGCPSRLANALRLLLGEEQIVDGCDLDPEEEGASS